MFFGLNKYIKNWLPKKLFYRSLFIIITPVILLQVIISIVFFDSLWIKSNKELTRTIVDEVRLISDVYKNNNEKEIERVTGLYKNNLDFIIAFNELLIIDDIDYLFLMLIGVFGVIGQIGLTISYQLSKASYVAPYSYFYIIFSGLIGFYIWNEIPDMSSLIGYFFIITSYYYLIRFQNQSLSDADQ